MLSVGPALMPFVVLAHGFVFKQILFILGYFCVLTSGGGGAGASAAAPEA